MSTVAVHIGVPKTATSYIQAWLHNNRRRLNEHGVFVPERPIRAHRLAVEHLRGAPWDSRADVIEIRNTPLDEAHEAFVQAAASNKVTSTIISSEYFYYGNPSVVAPALTEHFGPDLDIVVYIRSQGDLVLSGHNQDIKRLGKTASRPKPVYHKLYDWALLLDGWAKELGKDRIKVISYDVSARNRSILVDFINAACPTVSKPFADGAFEQAPIQNESLPADLLEFKRLANTLGDTGLYDYQWLEELVRTGYAGPKFGVSAEEAAAWRSFYKDSNEHVAREYFNGASADDIFPVDPQRLSGVDLEGKLTTETLVKIMAFAVRRDETFRKDTNQRLRILEQALANIRHSLPKPDPAKK
jgi:hypothetical protein